MFREDAAWAERAARVAALARDVTEVMTALGVNEPKALGRPVLAYHSACSMQHGQSIRDEPVALLRAAGFEVRDVPEGHICCGSAGTYNILQPAIATRSEEHTSELQSLMRISYAVFCLKKKKKKNTYTEL